MNSMKRQKDRTPKEELPRLVGAQYAISSDFSTEHGPPSSEQDPVDPSVSLSYEEASISLLSLSITGQTGWKPQSQKTNQSNHMDHSLV